MDGNHWITVAHSGNSDITNIQIYDSLGQSPSTETLHLIARYVGCRSNHLTVSAMNVQSQMNSYDRGVFALAFATAVAYGHDPTEQSYICNVMRGHVKSCVLSGCMLPFPSTTTCHKPKVCNTIQPTYCTCGYPDDGNVMIECDKCSEWFHEQCIGPSCL